MTTWLQALQAALKKVKEEELVEPQSEPGCHHYHEVGIVSLELRKLFYLSLKRKQQAQQAAAAVLTLSGTKRTAKLTEAARYDDESGTIRELFWSSCRHEFPELWDKEHISVHQGWKLHWCEHPPAHQLLATVMSGADLGTLLQGLGRGEAADVVEPAKKATSLH